MDRHQYGGRAVTVLPLRAGSGFEVADVVALAAIRFLTPASQWSGKCSLGPGSVSSSGSKCQQMSRSPMQLLVLTGEHGRITQESATSSVL